MNLEENVMAQMKDAMKAKDEAALRGLRAIKAEIIKAKTEPGAGGLISADAELKMLQKMVKQRKDALEIYKQQNRADLAQKESTREITKIFVKLKFNDFTRTTAERAGLAPTLGDFRSLLSEAFARTGKAVRLIGLGVRFAEATPESAQLDLL